MSLLLLLLLLLLHVRLEWVWANEEEVTLQKRAQKLALGRREGGEGPEGRWDGEEIGLEPASQPSKLGIRCQARVLHYYVCTRVGAQGK